MPLASTLRLLTAGALLSAALPALELRVDVLQGPSDFDYEYTEEDDNDNTVAEGDGSDTFDSGFLARGSLVGIWGERFQFSFIFGGYYLTAELDDGPKVSSYGMHAGMGLTWQFESGFFIGAEAFGGGGLGKAKPVETANGDDVDTVGFGAIYGVLGRVGYAFDFGLVLFAQGGQLNTILGLMNDGDIPTNPDNSVDLDIESSDLVFGGGLGFRF